MIRDYALAAGNLLACKVGGPSARPYQPEGVWEAVAMPESNTRIYQRDQGENLYRRSLYTFWKRSAPPASLDIFNAPSREVCSVRRERTNTARRRRRMDIGKTQELSSELSPWLRTDLDETG